MGGKLLSRYNRPFEILERVDTVSYWLALLPSLSGVHAVFHVSMLRTYTLDPIHVMEWDEAIIDVNGTFKEGPIRIMDSQDHVLQCKTVRLVKVLWLHRGMEEATWEREDTIRTNHHFLFKDEGMFYFSYDMKMVVHMHMIVCVYGCEFRDKFILKGEECKT